MFGRVEGVAVAPPGGVEFSAGDYAVDEAAGTATIKVERTGGAYGEVAVDYATQNGTASAGSDYTATSGILTFAEGETSKTFVVPITDDTRDDTDETVELALSNPQGGATLGAQNHATLTIADDDEPPPPANRAPAASGDSRVAPSSLPCSPSDGWVRGRRLLWPGVQVAYCDR